MNTELQAGEAIQRPDVVTHPASPSDAALIEDCASVADNDMAAADADLPTLLVYVDEDEIYHFKPAAIKGARWRKSNTRSMEHMALIAEEAMGCDRFALDFVEEKH